jgi:hypothetical protein
MTSVISTFAFLPTTESSCDTTTTSSKTYKRLKMLQRKLTGKMVKINLNPASQRLIVMNKHMSTSSTKKSSRCWWQIANYAKELPTSIISRSAHSKLNKTRNKYLLRRSNLVYKQIVPNVKAICLHHNLRKPLRPLISIKLKMKMISV